MPVTPRKRALDLTNNDNPSSVDQSANVALPNTPARGDIDRYFNEVLCPLVGQLPYNIVLSPEKRPKTPRHDAVDMVKFLYHQHRNYLIGFVDEFGRDQCGSADQTARFDAFIVPLTAAYKQLRPKPARPTSHRISNDHDHDHIETSKMPPPPVKLLWPSATRSNLTASANVNTSFDSTSSCPESATTSFASTTMSNAVSSNFAGSFDSTTTGLTSAGTSFISYAPAKTAASVLTAPGDSTQDDEMDYSSEIFGSSIDVSAVEDDEVERQAVAETSSRPIPAITPEPVDPKASARAPSADVSPSKLRSYRIRDIPKHGLAAIDLPEQLHRMPFHRRVEAYRVMRATRIQPDALVERVGADPSFADMYAWLPRWPPFGRSESFDLSRSTLHASLEWSSLRHGPAFDFALQIPQNDDLSAFQRRFGADRFMIVDMPSLERPPSDYNGQEQAIVESVLEMLRIPQDFLGRKWVAFWHHAKKRQIAFFAVSGVDIGNIVSISQLLDWYIPFETNRSQPACKANARLDLGQSRTKVAVTFEHHQIHHVRDSFATKDPSDTRFNDPALIPLFKHHFDANVVMNDGCNEISHAAMLIVQEVLQLDRLPAAVQGRIFGAKGIWYRSANEASDEMYINISGSQTKIRLDLDCKTDSAHLQLGISGWSRPARPSRLYPGFLPILQHRGVLAHTILEIARDQVRIDTSEFLACLQDRNALRQWVHQQKNLIDTRMRVGSLCKVGSFPNSGPERICLLTESGFDPDKCKKLADEAYQYGASVLDLDLKNFKVTLSQSTSVLGIADPTGVLKPGEIYLAFSQPFKTPSKAGGTLIMLDGEDCLVARNPAMRDSDIQRVHAVYRTELSHLQDVVVFSSRGNRPLANMLSGGDYDGDTFWVCWDHRLVGPFKNAPAPMEIDFPPLETFGITKDSTTLGDIVKTRDPAGRYLDTEVLEWISRSMARRLKTDLLGTVTLTHGKVIYGEIDISTDQANRLVDLHDLLVDGDKQGYLYTEDAWRAFKCQNGIKTDLRKPAYRRFTRPPEDRETDAMHEQLGDSDYHENDIIDRLYYEVVCPEVKRALETARARIRDVSTVDHDVTRLYRELRDRDATVNTVVADELKALASALKDIKNLWVTDVAQKYASSKKSSATKVWESGLEQCRGAYQAIKPVTSTTHPTIAEWVRQRGHNLTTWDEIKASAFAHHYHLRPAMVFSIAGFELCQIKAFSQGLPRVICEDMYLSLKPKKRKADYLPLDNPDLDDSDPDGDSRSDYASDSLIDAMESINEL